MSEQVVNAFLSATEQTLIVLHRDAGGTLVRREVPAEWSFFLRRADVPADLLRMLRGAQALRAVREEGDWLRVVAADRNARDFLVRGRKGGPMGPIVDRNIPTYEGDVHPVRRWLTDKRATIQRPRRAYYDLETDSRVPFSRKEEARVLSWAIVDDEGRRISAVLAEDSDSAERDLLAGFWEAFEPYDQAAAWNGEIFDEVVLRARAARHRLRYDPRRLLWLDHLVLFRRMNTHAAESGDEKQSMKLQAVAMATVGEGKNDFDASKTWEEWAAGGKARELLREYNEQDTALLAKIEKKTGYIDSFITIAEVSRVLPETRSLEPTRQADGYLMALGLERGLRFPTRLRREAVDKFEGAFVMEPTIRGIGHDVHVGDFKSLYPSIMISWNMSPETKRIGAVNGPIAPGLCRAPLTGVHFTNEFVGILAEIEMECLRLRKQYADLKASLPPGTPEWYDADRRSNAYKVFANSLFGITGSIFSRFYDPAIARSITKNGEWLIKKTMDAAIERGMEPVYGDTDSVFIANCSKTQFEEFVRWCNAELYPRLLESVGIPRERNRIELTYEKAFKSIVFTSKKRYAGTYAHYKGKAATADSKPEIKGLEYKRGDANLIARRLQEEIIHAVLRGESSAAARAIVDRYKRKVLEEPLALEEVRLAKALQQDLKEYSVRVKKDGGAVAQPPHVQVARMLLEKGEEVTEGTRIEYVVTDGSQTPAVVRPASEVAAGAEVDRYYLWENMVWPATQRFLASAYPEVDWKDGLERVRPRLLRRSAAGALPGQTALGFAAGDAKDDCVVIIAGRHADPVDEVVRRHPGPKNLVLKAWSAGQLIVLESGKRKVSGSPAMFDDLQLALFSLGWAYQVCHQENP